jgi:hypothetical protein
MNQSQEIEEVREKLMELIRTGNVQPFVESLEKQIASIGNTHTERVLLGHLMEITVLASALRQAVQFIKEDSPLYDMAITNAIIKSFLFGFAVGLEDDGIPEAFKEA